MAVFRKVPRVHVAPELGVHYLIFISLFRIILIEFKFKFKFEPQAKQVYEAEMVVFRQDPRAYMAAKVAAQQVARTLERGAADAKKIKRPPAKPRDKNQPRKVVTAFLHFTGAPHRVAETLFPLFVSRRNAFTGEARLAAKTCFHCFFQCRAFSGAPRRMHATNGTTFSTAPTAPSLR